MMVMALALLVVGLGLSAFFSGSETGFYRASRLRILMDAMQGDQVSRHMLFLTNRPPLFVATALVGNNTANYLTSLAIVLISKETLGAAGPMTEVAASIFFSPLVFVYGELMPKNLFYQAPNFLLRLASRWFLFFAVIFAPVSALLWLLGRFLEYLVGQSPEKVRLALARKELQDVFEEGQSAGILHPTQLQLAQNFFMVANRSVTQSMIPMSRVQKISRDATRHEALDRANKLKMTEIVVSDDVTGNLIGYLRTMEMVINDRSSSLARFINPLPEIGVQEPHGEALMRLEASGELLGKVVDESGKVIGVVSLDALTSPLLGGSLSSLHGPATTTDFLVDIQAT